MPGFGDLVQKAFYLGVGLAATAGEKAGGTLTQVRSQAQKLADEMVAKGEMTADEARRFVDDIIKQAQQPLNAEATNSETQAEPRRIEIVTDDEEPVKAEVDQVEEMRRQVQSLQDELQRLKRDGK